MNEQRLDENTVRYCLYPGLNEDAERYREYIDDCLAKLAVHLANFYWHYTPFSLRYIAKEASHSKVSHIEGCTNFDENIEDEWFIVFLLFELSRGDPDLVVQVEDSDGYFLLIEAADHLPKWVKPKTTLNRCFIYRGQLHLIPPNLETKQVTNQAKSKATNRATNQKMSQTGEQLTVRQALQIVRDPQLRTVCSVEVQNAVRARIEGYPAKIGDLLHRCRVVLPCSVAYLLARDPTLICHAIRAFYNRDDQDLAACSLMRHFPGRQPVSRLVHLTKFGYAQLLGQQYKPDSRLNWCVPGAPAAGLPAADSRAVGSPAANLPADSSANTPTERQFDLGFKISCGFEILASTPAERLSAPRQTARWRSFVSRLKARNYFDNLIEHSNEYDERLAKARRYFENSELSEVSGDGALIGHAQIGRRIGELLSDFDEAKAVLQFRSEQLPAEDADDWLNELPGFLVNSERQSYDDLPSEITDCLQEFIRTDSDYKGVEPAETNPKKRKSDLNEPKSDLKERAFRMMSDNLRSIITMKVSDSESDQTETDLSDYDYSSAESSNGEEELRYMKGQRRATKSRKFKEKQVDRKKRAKCDPANSHSRLHEDPHGHSDSHSDGHSDSKEIKQLMQAMDDELASTTIGQSFEKLSLAKRNVPMASCAEFDEEDYSSDEAKTNGLEPIDVQYNTVKNLLGSFKEQNGRSGPASNILQSLGVRIPKDLD